LRAANAGSWKWNAENQTVDVCENFQRLLGHPGGDSTLPLGEWLSLFHEDDREQVLRILHDERHRSLKSQIRLRNSHGDYIWFFLHADWYRDLDSEPWQLAGVNVDIDTVKRAEEQARQAVQKLREADARKDEFLAMLAHELRNPLAPIVTSAQVLDKVAPGDARIAWVREVIERQVTHLAGLVDDLLDVSRITQGKITLHREAVELGKVLEHSLEIVKPLIDSKRHTLSVHVPETPIWVFGDFSRLSQIFSNVLHNAAKYTTDGGSIDLDVVDDRGSVAVRVRDNGIGIEPQFLPHVFEVFTQGYRGLDRSQGGLGVGLAVVRRLIELHQGEVNIMSDGPGLGTEVVIRLPCISEVVQHAGREAPRLPSRGGKRILVVDDNADAAESIAVLMQIDGHEVKTVTDAMQALACLDTFAPQVAIIDIGLPGMNGYELAAGIRANRSLPKPLLIALTGYGQAEDFDRSRDAGFDHHFVKPAEMQAIQAVIDAASEDAEVEERRTLV